MRIRAALVRLIAVVGLIAPMGVVTATATQAAVTCPPRLGLTSFNNNFDAGTTIPYTNTDYVSQGLAYWPAKDWLITSLSDDHIVLGDTSKKDAAPSDVVDPDTESGSKPQA